MKIAIDGPAGSGKSTVAKRISQVLNIPYLDTGALYRVFAYISLVKGVDPAYVEGLLKLFEEDIRVQPSIGKTHIYYKGKPLEDRIRTEEVGRQASIIASLPEFRERMIRFFRELVGDAQVVAEGRDVGTHIFPDAPLKFFLTATPEERAKRRCEELRSKGQSADYGEILRAILERDERDRNRPLYPFRPAEDAIVVDTTGMNVEEVVELLLQRIKAVVKDGAMS